MNSEIVCAPLALCCQSARRLDASRIMLLDEVHEDGSGTPSV